MHSNQPLCGNGFPYGPYYNCPPPIQCGGICPEIIGEGEITSVALPDGTVQFLFNPSMEWSPYQFNPSNANMNCRGPYQNVNTGAWLIRSIANPIPASTFNPASQRYELQRPFYETNCNFNARYNGFQIKFHNDNCTSTSDIHYFYPSLRRYECYGRTPTQACAAVQVEPVTDNAIHHYICAKPCNCAPMHCYDTEGSQSSMSIENRSKENLKYSSSKEKRKENKHASRERKRPSKTKSKVICECDIAPKVPVIDKSVTTYADNASSCAPVGGRETQTCCGNPVPVVTVKNNSKGSNVQTERWYPKTTTSKKQMKKISLTRIIGLSSSCSSKCSCRSDTE